MAPVLRRQIQECGFSFLTDSEVRALSVQRIISPIAFDSFNNPLRGGLYDAALGPIDLHAVCPTCSLAYRDCPGHLGHVDLCVPVYNPLLFPQLYQLLRVKCFTCHRFRVGRAKLQRQLCRLLLLQQQNLKDALQFDERLEEITHKGTPEDKERALAQWKEELVAQPRAPAALGAHARSVKRELVARFFGAAGNCSKCENCGAARPKIRKVGYTKFFVMSASQGDTFEADDDAFEGFGDDPLDSGPAHALEDEVYLAPLDVYDHVRKLWEHDYEMAVQLYGAGCRNDEQRRAGWSIFFRTCLAVPPCRFRPPQLLGDTFSEHPHNTLLQKILVANERLRASFDKRKPKEPARGAKAKAAGKGAAALTNGASGHGAPGSDGHTNGDPANGDLDGDGAGETGLEDEDLMDGDGELVRQAVDIPEVLSNWIVLQDAVNIFIDSSKDASAKNDMVTGVRQLLEKKEGLFRKHMMGKRVNYACRSVISPDPYIGTAEIGIPQRFARTLSFPQKVSPFNVATLRRLVETGDTAYPGANFVENHRGQKTDLRRMSEEQRHALAARLLTTPGQTVWRHVHDGDVMLLNRQPTLHKPGIMAHLVRVLYSAQQQTIRMHYANCNTYNADFDGDEMNAHLPQDEISRAEAYTIAATNQQYIVPTDGSPLRGLIQDHVDAGVKLCLRDCFFSKEHFYQLVHAATTGMSGIAVCPTAVRLLIPQPAVLKPRPLWTGKQIFSVLLQALTRGRPSMHFEGKSRMPADALGSGLLEQRVLVRRGSLLGGVLDKGSFGASSYGLAHAVQELYGGRAAGAFLNGLARLLTYYLHFLGGHTCSIEDLMLTEAADAARRRIIRDSRELGTEAMRKLVLDEGGVEVQELQRQAQAGAAGSRRGGADAELLRRQVEAFVKEAPGTRGARIDGHMTATLAPVNSELLQACLPHLYTPFPRNSFALMVLTGAKGSKVNMSQISCALGQQALEGRRVPLMSSGKTLPAFGKYEAAPRAGGFVADRFLTGVRPAEYYFHCMAGREGLVDTAVKTSRSGYLQRCLVKFLEDLRVGYDHTVRNAEGSVVQFLYGEDGVDPTQASYLSADARRLGFLSTNKHVYVDKYGIEHQDVAAKMATGDARLQVLSHSGHLEGARTALAHRDAPVPVGAFVLTRVRKKHHKEWCCGSLQPGWFPAEVMRVYKPKAGHPQPRYTLRLLDGGLEIRKVPEMIVLDAGAGKAGDFRSGALRILKRALPEPLLSSSTGCPSWGVMPEALVDAVQALDGTEGEESRSRELEALLKTKYLRSLAAPGEAVGTIAAQSVGEPSTQMTLNTFHLAGHGGANVTLGIPRLREIIMTAARHPRTPLVKIPLLSHVSREAADLMARKLGTLRLSEILHHEGGIRVRETLARDGIAWSRVYEVRLRFQDLAAMEKLLDLSFQRVVKFVENVFVAKLLRQIQLLFGRMDVKDRASVGAKAQTIAQRGAYVAATPAAVGAAGASSSPPGAEGLGGQGKGGVNLDDGDEQDEDSDMEEGEGTFRLGRQKDDDYDDDEPPEAPPRQTAANDSDDDVPIADLLGDGFDDLDAGSAMSESSDGPEGGLEAVPVTKPFTPKRKRPAVQSAGMVKVFEDDGAVAIFLSTKASTPRLLVENIVRELAQVERVRSTEGIARASVLDVSKEAAYGGRFKWAVQTEGSNLKKLWSLFASDLAFNDIDCNDIWKISQVYGIEACRAAISREVTRVFAVYGISVDPRHLSLISDAMTFSGEYTPMNRIGMNACPSPYLQMSFETTTKFLLEAALDGTRDTLESPSAALVVGKVPKVGTGCMQLLQPTMLSKA